MNVNVINEVFILTGSKRSKCNSWTLQYEFS